MTNAALALNGSRRNSLPKPIVKVLRRVMRRRRQVILVRGIPAVLAVAVAALLAVMAVDATLTLFSTAARWVLTGAGAIAVGAAAFWFVVRPMARHLTLARVARMVETHHPELQERISSAVELLSSDESSDLRGSQALIDELAKEATRDVTVVIPQREISARRAVPYVLAALGGLAVLGSLYLLWPEQTSRLMVRAVAPYAAVGNLGSLKMEVLPGDTVLPKGESLRVDVRIAGRVKAATFWRRTGDVEISQPMTRLPEGPEGESRFTLSVPSGETSFQYRVRTSTDAVSTRYRVTVTPRPAVTRCDLVYKYPAYTGREPKTEENVTGDIVALAGTTVTVRTHLNKPVADARLLLNGEPLPDHTMTMHDGAPVASWELPVRRETAGHWKLEVTDQHGLRNNGISHTVRSVPDKPPTIRKVYQPHTTQLRLRPTDRLPVEYLAQDDYGIAAADLLVQVDDGDKEAMPAPLPAQRPLHPEEWRGRATLDLDDLDLANATRVQFQLRVSDALPPAMNGPQRGVSRTYTITIDRAAPSYVEQAVEERAERIEKDLQQIKKRLVEAKEHVDAAKPSIDKAEKLTPEDRKKIKQTREAIGKAERSLDNLAEKESGSEFTPVARKAEAVRKRHVEPARKAAERIETEDKKTERSKQTARTQEHLDKAIRAVDKMIAELKADTERAKMAKQLDELARREEELAAQAADAAKEAGETGQEPKPLDDEWKKDQEDVAKKIGEMLQKDDDALHQALKNAEQDAKQVARKAGELAKEQQDLQQTTQEAGRPAPSEEELQKRIAEHIRKAQQQIAKETNKLAEDVDRKKLDADGEHRNASQSTQKAADELKKDDFDKAAEAGKQAEKELNQAARNLEQPQQGQPNQQDQQGDQNPQNQQDQQDQQGDPNQQNQQDQQDQQSSGQNQQQQQEQRQKAAQKANELAKRQASVNKQMKAFQQGDIAKALEEMQKDVARRAAELARDAERLQQQAEAMGSEEQAMKNAERAAQQLAEGSKEAQKASEQMQAEQQAGEPGEKRPGQSENSDQQNPPAQGEPSNQDSQKQPSQGEESHQDSQQNSQNSSQQSQQSGKPSPEQMQQASQNQQKAAEAMQQAAQAAQAMQQAMQQAAAQAQQNASQQSANQQSQQQQGQPLANAFEQAMQAMQAQQAQQSAQSAQQAAQSLAQSARQMGMPQQMQPSQPNEMPGEPQMGMDLMKQIAGEGRIPDRLRKLGIAADDWIKLPSDLRNQILKAADQRAPQDYRLLVKRYFRELARRGSEHDE
jgi:hypothetical protein